MIKRRSDRLPGVKHNPYAVESATPRIYNHIHVLLSKKFVDGIVKQFFRQGIIPTYSLGGFPKRNVVFVHELLDQIQN
jgi:hypothetical protein